ncbi:hypothetical protein CHS0354_018841 [Potamilus streckersoni]|uniref:Uncharacterized protein n=1 Tax=Potamilus streckersoni TaxID=2493646 RepID=A0AAE0VWI4_9BIVA|nr:hypothetical protein CHS0354_018841 [Potamilus streckersoni]
MEDARAGQCGIFRKRSTDDVHEEYESFDVDKFEDQEIPKMIYKRNRQNDLSKVKRLRQNIILLV